MKVVGDDHLVARFHQPKELELLTASARASSARTYDAVYVALAESLGATLVALDGPLYRNARARGLPVELLA